MIPLSNIWDNNDLGDVLSLGILFMASLYVLVTKLENKLAASNLGITVADSP